MLKAINTTKCTNATKDKNGILCTDNNKPITKKINGIITPIIKSISRKKCLSWTGGTGLSIRSTRYMIYSSLT